MRDDKFYEYAFPEPYTILGVRLRPLSIGHLILLYGSASPFLVQGETLNVGHLAFAVRLCSKTYEEGCAMIEDEKELKNIHDWARELQNVDIDYNERAKLFIDYLTEGQSVPGYSVEEGKSKAIKNIPQMQIVRVELLSKTNIPDHEILNRPYKLCLLDFLTLRALAGQLEFVEHDQIKESVAKANAIMEQLEQGRNQNVKT